MSLSYPGEYPQPILRPTEFRVPVVAGFTTARLRRTPENPISDAVYFGASGPNLPTSDANATVLFVNTGATPVAPYLRQTDSYTSGPYFAATAPVTIQPGGTRNVQTQLYRRYVDLYGASGTGNVRVSISSQTTYQEMGFSKTDATYPTALWQPSNLVGFSQLDSPAGYSGFN